MMLALSEPGTGKVEVQQVGEETTKTGAPKETFGEGRAAQSEAGKKGGAISGARLAHTFGRPSL